MLPPVIIRDGDLLADGLIQCPWACTMILKSVHWQLKRCCLAYSYCDHASNHDIDSCEDAALPPVNGTMLPPRHWQLKRCCFAYCCCSLSYFTFWLTYLPMLPQLSLTLQPVLLTQSPLGQQLKLLLQHWSQSTLRQQLILLLQVIRRGLLNCSTGLLNLY